MTDLGYYSSSLGWVNQATNSDAGIFEIGADLNMEGYSIINADNGTFAGDVSTTVVKAGSIQEKDVITNVLPILSPVSDVFYAGGSNGGGVINLAANAVIQGNLSFSVVAVTAMNWPDFNTVDAEFSTKSDGTGDLFSSFTTIITNNTLSDFPVMTAGTGHAFNFGAGSKIKSKMTHVYFSVIGSVSYNTSLVSQASATTLGDFTASGGLYSGSGLIGATGGDLNVGTTTATLNTRIGQIGQTTSVLSDDLLVRYIDGNGVALNLGTSAAALGVNIGKATQNTVVASDILRIEPGVLKVDTIDAINADLVIGGDATSDDVNIGRAGQNVIINGDNLKVDNIVSTTGGGTVNIEGVDLRAQGTTVDMHVGDIGAAPPTDTATLDVQAKTDVTILQEADAEDNGSGNVYLAQQIRANKFYAGISLSQTDQNLVIEAARKTSETANDILFKTGGSYAAAPALGTRASPLAGVTALKIDGANQDVEVTNKLLFSGGISIGDNTVGAVATTGAFGDSNTVTTSTNAYAFGSSNSVTGANNSFILGNNLTVTAANTAKLIENTHDIEIGESLKFDSTNKIWSATEAAIVENSNLFTSNATPKILTVREFVGGVLLNQNTGASTITFPSAAIVKTYLANYAANTPTTGADTAHTSFTFSIWNPTIYTITLFVGAGGSAVGTSFSAGVAANTAVLFKVIMTTAGWTACRVSTATV